VLSLSSLIQLPHMLLVPANAPRRLYALGAITTAWPIHLLAAPHIDLLLAIIILKYLLIIIFFILVDIFLVYSEIEKTQNDTHMVVFKLGMLLKKLGPMHMFWNFYMHFCICVQKYEMSTRKIGAKNLGANRPPPLLFGQSSSHRS
jgi:hypothetical protein